MGFGNIKGLRFYSKRTNGNKRWFVEYNGNIVSEPLKSREEAINSVMPLIIAMKKHRESVTR